MELFSIILSDPSSQPFLETFFGILIGTLFRIPHRNLIGISLEPPSNLTSSLVWALIEILLGTLIDSLPGTLIRPYWSFRWNLGFASTLVEILVDNLVETLF